MHIRMVAFQINPDKLRSTVLLDAVQRLDGYYKQVHQPTLSSRFQNK